MNLSLSTRFTVSQKSLGEMLNMIAEARNQFDSISKFVAKTVESGMIPNRATMDKFQSTNSLMKTARLASSWENHDQNTETSISLEWLLFVQSYCENGQASGWFAEFMKIVITGDEN